MNEIIKILKEYRAELDEIKKQLDKLSKPVPCHLAGTWLDGQDVLLLLHISKRSLQSLRDTKKLPFSRINGKFYYKVADIEQLLEKNYSKNFGTNFINLSQNSSL